MTASARLVGKPFVSQFQAGAVAQEAEEPPLRTAQIADSAVYRREKGEQLYNAFGGFAGLLRYSTGV